MSNLKNTRKILTKLEQKFGFRKPYQILLDSSMIKLLNDRSFKINVLKSLLSCEPSLIITTCTYKNYKSQHKYLKLNKVSNEAKNKILENENGDSNTENNIDKTEIITEGDSHQKNNSNPKIFQNNREKKEWKKNRFIDDFIRHCEIRKCNCEVTDNGKIITKENECLSNFVSRKIKDHYFLAFYLKSNLEAINKLNKKEIIPILSYKGNEFILSTREISDKIQNKNKSEVGVTKKELLELEEMFGSN